jgi:integrase
VGYDLCVDNEQLLKEVRLDQERRGVLSGSILSRERRVKALMEWAKPRSMLDLGREDIQRYLDELGISAASRRNYLSHYHAFYSWAVKAEYTTAVPTLGIVRPKLRKYLPRPIPNEELIRAIDSAPDSVRCYLTLMAYQGLRCQEVAGLEGQDVDRTMGLLHVRHGKGGKERSLPLHPRVATVLPSGSGPLFHLKNGKQTKPHNVSHAVNRFLHGLEISSTAHTLRHAFATQSYRASRDIILVQNLMGHSSPATTGIYASADPKGAAVVQGLSFGEDD